MTLLVELAVKSTVVAGAALVLLSLLRRRSAAERSWVAHAALVVLVALPAAVALLPRWRLMPPVERTPALPAVAAPATPQAATAIDPSLWLQVFYAGGVALLLLATLVAVLRLVAVRRGADVLADPHWLTALARAKARMKVRSGAALLVSPALTSPVSWGLIRPTIVVNQDLVAAKHDAEAVIAHELAHVVRRDWAKLIGARLVTAIFWFNPLVWALAGQCHQLREEAADDAVLGAEVSSTDYANLLVEAARRHGRRFAAAHGVAPGRGSLHRRVTRVLDAAVRRTPTRGAWGVGVVAAAALFAGPLAALTLEPAVTVAAADAPGIVTDPETAPATVTVVAAPARKAAPARAAVTARAPAPAKSAAVALTGSTSTLAKAAAPSVAITGGPPMAKGKLTLAGDKLRFGASPVLTNSKPGAPRLTLAQTQSPPAPKVAIAASPRAATAPAKPAAEIVIADEPVIIRNDPLTPRTVVTVTGKATATVSSSSSQTLTANGKTLRVEADARSLWTAKDADWRGDRADQRDRLKDQADRRADEADRRRDEAERREDMDDHRRDEAERIRDQREAERDAARDARRAVEAKAAKQRRTLAAEARRVEQQAAAAAARQKAAASLP
jgi:beta-lactamase regulating signal transducer with metallopeptidase domain